MALNHWIWTEIRWKKAALSIIAWLKRNLATQVEQKFKNFILIFFKMKWQLIRVIIHQETVIQWIKALHRHWHKKKEFSQLSPYNPFNRVSSLTCNELYLILILNSYRIGHGAADYVAVLNQLWIDITYADSKFRPVASRHFLMQCYLVCCGKMYLTLD